MRREQLHARDDARNAEHAALDNFMVTDDEDDVVIQRTGKEKIENAKDCDLL